MDKYWHLLVAEYIVSKYVNIRPQINLKRASSLKDHLVKSHYVNKQERPVPQVRGTKPCGKLNFCNFMINKKSDSTKWSHV